MITKTIKFGTDGWRAIIADDFTVDNVKRVAAATAEWIRKNYPDNMRAVVGYDCRFGGQLFAETTARVLASNGIKTDLSPGFVSTPMISLATLERKAACGIIITASHNPPSYNGYKIKGNFGGPALPYMIDEIEKEILWDYEGPFETLEKLVGDSMIEYYDMEIAYAVHAESSFDLEKIKSKGYRIAYDGMYGAGQRIVKRLLPEALMIHSDFNPSFNGQAPEPIMKNLTEFADLIKTKGNIDFAFATDGDADRIGVLDSNGNFIDSHHLILILVNYLKQYKNLEGNVVNSFSCTSRIARLCSQTGLENVVTKIGFKYICEYMVKENVLVGGEESGGIAVANHIPERDGVWIALTLLEFMATTGKSLADLVSEVYSIVGEFALERYDIHITDEEKKRLIENLKEGAFNSFGNYTAIRTEDLDGFKFYFDDNRWVMVRPSGTEPVLRIYAEAPTYAEAIEILNATQATLFESAPALH